MNIKIIFAVIAGGLAIAGNVPYMRDMFRGRITPHPYTWFIWSIVSGVTLAGQITKGAGWATIAFASSEVFTVLIFLFSLRYGFKNIPKRDTYYLVFALLGIIPWLVTNDPTWSVVIMVAIDLVAFIPTLRKAWEQPKTENYLLYGSNALRHSFALVALSSYNVATMLHSIAMIATNTTMTAFILRKKKKPKKA